MSLVVNTNVEALVAQNNLSQTENSLSMATTDLSSGLRINTAADDAAGYAITEDLSAQVNGLGQAQQNAQDAVSLVQTADGTLNDVEQMLQRVNELAVQYNNGTNDSQDLQAIQSEVDQLTSEISRVGQTAQFNGISLFSGATTITFQVGSQGGQTIAVTTQSMSALVSSTIDLSSAGAISSIDTMINNVSAAAANLGAVQNRLGYTLDDLQTYSENLTSAQSSIQDVDMASETTTFTSEQVLEQSGIAMLSQAQQQPQMALKLLQSI